MAQPTLTAAQLPLLKLLLHAAKYPASSVNGALLGTVNAASGAVVVTDVVPLFHTVLTLAPSIEVALAQLEAHVSSPGSKVQLVGYYHADARYAACDLSVIGRRIADRISEHTAGAVVLMLDAKKLTGYLAGDSEPHGPLEVFAKWDGSKGWKREVPGSLTLKEGKEGWKALKTSFLAAIAAQQQRTIADFDEHLDDVAVDYFNAGFAATAAKFALPGQLA